MKKILYIDMDNVLVDFQSAFPKLDKQTLIEFEGKEDDIPGMFALMDPMPLALQSYEELRVLFDTYILSTAPWANPSAWSDKLKWVKKHLGESAKKTLIISHHKNLNIGDFLVDDRKKNGADKFQGELILFGSNDFTDWEAVLQHLRKQAEGG